MTPLEQRARDLALERHAGQRYGATALPIAYHLAHVVGVMARLGHDRPVLRAAGWLHDLLEDTDATPGDMLEVLTTTGLPYPKQRRDVTTAGEVIRLVRAVSKPKGRTRREGLVDYLAQIRAAGRDAILLKLMDRIANVEASVLAVNHGLLRMYQQEQGAFVAGLFQSDDRLSVEWTALDYAFAGRVR